MFILIDVLWKKWIFSHLCFPYYGFYNIHNIAIFNIPDSSRLNSSAMSLARTYGVSFNWETRARKANVRFNSRKLTEGLTTVVTLWSDVTKLSDVTHVTSSQWKGDNRLLYRYKTFSKSICAKPASAEIWTCHDNPTRHTNNRYGTHELFF